MANARVTVFGGSGFIGRHLAAQLLTSGLKVRVAVRHADRISDQSVEAVAGDVLDDSSVASAVQGASAVINLVGILNESGRQTYTAVHVEAARRVALAARNAGASRLIHLSALGATKAAPALSDRTKAEGEVIVRAAFPEATIIRPSLVFGSDDHFFTRFAEMALRSPVLPLIGSGATKFQPAHVEDVAAAIARVLTRSDTAGRVYEFGGPEVYSLKGLLDLMLAAVGWRRLLVPVPFSLAEVLADLLELLPAPFLTRDQVRLLRTDKANSGREPTLTELGIRPTDLRAFLFGAFKAKYAI
ncbi:MAG TPA: complex I NDUFA9 subunit family protein [Stellaceae bacterium]|nr:complex I NDUFA9 subunit family protein [Stellaceae bacterium]